MSDVKIFSLRIDDAENKESNSDQDRRSMGSEYGREVADRERARHSGVYSQREIVKTELEKYLEALKIVAQYEKKHGKPQEQQGQTP